MTISSSSDTIAVQRSIASSITDGIKVYGTGDSAVRALDGVTTEFRSGEFAAIMGPSGSGKSTLLHCLATLDTLTTGRVTIEGIDVAGLSDKERTILRRSRVGFVFQAYNLVPTLSMRENILLPMTLAGDAPTDEWFNTVTEALAISDRLDHRPAELSGGQQQRAAVARALLPRPAIIFADEPTGNLDSTSGTSLLQFLRTSVDEMRATIVMVTHDAHAASFSDRVVFLVDGKIVTEHRDPTRDTVLDTLRVLGEKAPA